MTPINDGGAAFSRPYSLERDGFARWAQNGMSLRDYFAGQALIAMLPVYAGMNGGHQNGIGTDHIVSNVSAHAYRMADAMLKARENER